MVQIRNQRYNRYNNDGQICKPHLLTHVGPINAQYCPWKSLSCYLWTTNGSSNWPHSAKVKNDPLPNIDIIKVWNIGQIERIPPWNTTPNWQSWGPAEVVLSPKELIQLNQTHPLHLPYMPSIGSRSPWWHRGFNLHIFSNCLFLTSIWIDLYMDFWIYEVSICDNMLYFGCLWTSISLPLISTSLIPLHPKFSPGFVGRSQLGTERVHNGWKRCH